MAQPIISVLIADDHAFSSDGLQQMLQATGRVRLLPPARSGIEALALARAETPDLAVLDHAMPGGTGLEILFEIRRWSPATRVAILTGTASVGLLSQIEASGADGLFLKSADPAAICAGLLAVAEGQRVIAPEVVARLETASEALSRRELEVLRAIAEGLTNPGIADRLSISVKTVESHRASLMRKMGVNSTASLLMRAMRDGLLPP